MIDLTPIALVHCSQNVIHVRPVATAPTESKVKGTISDRSNPIKMDIKLSSSYLARCRTAAQTKENIATQLKHAISIDVAIYVANVKKDFMKVISIPNVLQTKSVHVQGNVAFGVFILEHLLF